MAFHALERIERGGTLSERREQRLEHRRGKGHDANFPAGTIYGEGNSGADSSWEYNGAWMYETLYLWWFYADGRRTTQALKDHARHEANLYIDNAFAKRQT